ncbi:MAG: FliH/SctL family protein [Rhodospirillaceae bacterium]|nr:FliH/SctL family protein [Rhodospirillaceae bacterium]
MGKLDKYMFDLDFDAPPPRPESVMTTPDAGLEAESFDLDGSEELDLPPSPPVFSEEDVSIAREQAFEAGRQTGLREAEEASARLEALSLANLAEHIRALDKAQKQASQERLGSAVDLALAITRKILPETAQQNGAEEIVGVVRDCLARIDEPVRVTVRVHPDYQNGVRDRMQTLAEENGFEGKLIVAADSRIAPGDCRVEWGDGGAERDQERVWNDIDALIAQARDRNGVSGSEADDKTPL